MTVEHLARSLFARSFGGEPEIVVRSPARVNLIGDHTDYNGGLALPLAIDRELWIAARAAPGGRAAVSAVSDDPDHRTEFALAAQDDRRVDGWGIYPQGVARALEQAGHRLTGWHGAIASNVPNGAGLSSSAALELAVARVFAAVSNLSWDPFVMAKACQWAENEWVGVDSGLLDQLACATCRHGAALRIDFRSMATKHVAVPRDVSVVVMDTTTRRQLKESRYNERRRECEAAAEAFGVASLRELTLDRISASSGVSDLLLRRARHVVTENARVEAAVVALEAQDAAELGRLLDRSHLSLRDDFETSSAVLDAIVEAARSSPGCHGARVTGGGFAGCAVALVASEALDDFTASTLRGYQRATGLDAALYACRAVAGTQRVA